MGDEMKLGPSSVIDRSSAPGPQGFGLISLEVAQERERMKAVNRQQAKAHARYHTEPAHAPIPAFESHKHPRRISPASFDEPRLARTPSYATPSDASSPQVTHRVKGKKSGLMELWNKASSSRPRPPEHAFPTPATSRPAPTRE